MTDHRPTGHDSGRPRPEHSRNQSQMLAAVAAGHAMAQMPLTQADLDALIRVQSGRTTTAEELERLHDEISERRDRSDRA